MLGGGSVGCLPRQARWSRASTGLRLGSRAMSTTQQCLVLCAAQQQERCPAVSWAHICPSDPAPKTCLFLAAGIIQLSQVWRYVSAVAAPLARLYGWSMRGQPEAHPCPSCSACVLRIENSPQVWMCSLGSIAFLPSSILLQPDTPLSFKLTRAGDFSGTVQICKGANGVHCGERRPGQGRACTWPGRALCARRRRVCRASLHASHAFLTYHMVDQPQEAAPDLRSPAPLSRRRADGPIDTTSHPSLLATVCCCPAPLLMRSCSFFARFSTSPAEGLDFDMPHPKTFNVM